MIAFTIIAVVVFLLWCLACYYITMFIATTILKFRSEIKAVNKKALLLVSLLIAVISTYFFFFTSPARNYKTATISQEQFHFKVTVKGKRILMSHDIFSVFSRNTYEDSIVFTIPKQQGEIPAHEIKVSGNRFKPIGAITIMKEKMHVKLFYDIKQTEPNSWNGNYSLVMK